MKVGTSNRVGLALMAIAAGNIVQTARGRFKGMDIQRQQLYHRLDVSATTSQLEFFNVQPSQHVCNMPAGANGLPNDYGFVCTGIHAQFEYGYNVAGTAVTAVEGYNTTVAPLTVANDLRHLYDKGLFRLDFNNDEVAEVYGLGQLSGGNAANIQAAHTNSTATTINSFANVTNGQHDDNAFAMSPWQILWPGTSARARVDYNFTRSLVGAYVLKITLDGIRVRA